MQPTHTRDAAAELFTRRRHGLQRGCGTHDAHTRARGEERGATAGRRERATEAAPMQPACTYAARACTSSRRWQQRRGAAEPPWPLPSPSNGPGMAQTPAARTVHDTTQPALTCMTCGLRLPPTLRQPSPFPRHTGFATRRPWCSRTETHRRPQAHVQTQNPHMYLCPSDLLLQGTQLLLQRLPPLLLQLLLHERLVELVLLSARLLARRGLNGRRLRDRLLLPPLILALGPCTRSDDTNGKQAGTGERRWVAAGEGRGGTNERGRGRRGMRRFE